MCTSWFENISFKLKYIVKQIGDARNPTSNNFCRKKYDRCKNDQNGEKAGRKKYDGDELNNDNPFKCKYACGFVEQKVRYNKIEQKQCPRNCNWENPGNGPLRKLKSKILPQILL